MTDALPPHDIEAEEACVAAALVDSEALDALHFVRPEMFFREKNGWIWSAILDVARGKDGHVNTITVAHHLAGMGRLDDVGGQTYMSDIIRRLMTPVGAEYYGRIVEEAWQRRRHISILSAAQQALYDPTAGTVPEVAGRLMEQLLRTAVDRTRVLTRSAAEIMRGDGVETPGVVMSIDRLIDSDRVGEIQGLDTGWHELNVMIGGLLPAQVITVLAATSIGKSWLVQFFAWNLVRQGVPVMLVTTEMSGEEVMERLTFMEAGVDRKELRSRAATEDEIRRIHIAESETTTWPLYICDVGMPNLDMIVSEARRLKALHGICVLIIDHINHIRVQGIRDPVERLTEVTGTTKALAVNLGINVIQVCHVNRDEAKNGWVGLYSGKGSSSIEQDSNVVLSLNQLKWGADGNAYAPTRREADEFIGKNGWHRVYLTGEKNRNGGQGGLEGILDWRVGGRFAPAGGE